MDPMTFVTSTFLVILANIVSSTFGSCVSTKSFNLTGVSEKAFAPAVATWFGPPNGAGSDGGACGFENDVGRPPYSARISAGNRALFKGGKGCGTCYSVLCNQNPACSGRPITVTITDECGCNNEPIHFDLSGTALGLLAKPGQDNALRNAGKINILFQRVPCSYPNQKLVFKVDRGSNKFFFSTNVAYENGDGDIGTLEIQPAGSNQFFTMRQVVGATYSFNFPKETSGPFTLRLTQVESKRSVVAQNVIPANWAPGQRFTAAVNF